MTALALLAAALAALAVLALTNSLPTRPAAAQVSAGPTGGSAVADYSRDEGPQPSRAWQLRAAAAFAGIGLWAVLGGVLGVAAGLTAAVLGPKALGALETKSTRVRRQRLAAAAPQVADLLAVCLEAGSTMPVALRVVSQTCPEPAAELLRLAVGRLELGADPESTWATLASEPAFAPIARAAVRSDTSGAPLAQVLLGVADELRQRHRATIESAARTVGVRAVGPLGACFLPAFMLLGVVPLVASLLQRVIP